MSQPATSNLPPTLTRRQKYFIVYKLHYTAFPSAKTPPGLNIVSIHTDQASADRQIDALAENDRPTNVNAHTHYAETTGILSAQSDTSWKRRWVSRYENGERREVGYQQADVQDGDLGERVS